MLNVCFWHINEFLSSKIQSSHRIFPFLSNSFNLRIKLVLYKLSNKTQSHELRHYILHTVTTNVMYYHCATVGNGWSIFMTIWILAHTLNFILRLLYHDDSSGGSHYSSTSSSIAVATAVTRFIINLWKLIYPLRFTHVSDI